MAGMVLVKRNYVMERISFIGKKQPFLLK